MIRSPAGTGRYNIAPTEEVLAIIAPKGEPEAHLLRWGLIPPWARDPKVAYKMINARIERVTEKPAFSGLIAKGSRRALQVADGWFEWIKPEKPGEPRQPFHFQVDGGVPFAFASLWTPARIEDEWVHSVTLLTCDSAPNRVARAIHERMPVVLADQESQQAWLSPELGAADVLELCTPLQTERLTVRAANPAVNKADQSTEGPDLLIAPE